MCVRVNAGPVQAQPYECAHMGDGGWGPSQVAQREYPRKRARVLAALAECYEVASDQGQAGNKRRVGAC